LRVPGPRDPRRATMAKATWNGAVLAESDETVVVEGNHYFPAASVNWDLFQPSDTHTVCGWKGTASYYDVIVDEAVNKDAAWYYPQTKPAAANIRGYIAFWRGVKVET
jgi:uncharacterized protein (DUF427 family)